jgi:hypothetical protein
MEQLAVFGVDFFGRATSTFEQDGQYTLCEYSQYFKEAC